MIKREEEELAQIASAQRLPQQDQTAQNSLINSRIFQYPFLDQNLYFSYPPQLYQHYEQAYHNYPHMPTNYRNCETALCPPALAPQNDIKVKQEQKIVRPRVTRSCKNSKKRVKVKKSQRQGQEADYVPSRSLKKLGQRQGSRRRRSKFMSHSWSAEQNRRYMQFLINHPGLFELQRNVKKDLRVNVMMSKKVKTRSPQQCHSHHQKMTNKHGSIEKVIGFLQSQKAKKEKRKEMEDQVKEENENENRPYNVL